MSGRSMISAHFTTPSGIAMHLDSLMPLAEKRSGIFALRKTPPQRPHFLIVMCSPTYQVSRCLNVYKWCAM